MLNKVREYYPEMKLNATTWESFNAEHAELSKINSHIKRAWSTHYVFDDRMALAMEEPIEVHLAFTEFQAQYVITQPLHSSQELVSKGKNEYIFKYHLVPNFEFISTILGWGEEVEVLRPDWLRVKIEESLHNILLRYSKK